MQNEERWYWNDDLLRSWPGICCGAVTLIFMELLAAILVSGSISME